MQQKRLRFTGSQVDFYFDASFTQLSKLVDKKNAILITDANVHAAHPSRFKGWKTIVLPAGEATKVQNTVDEVIRQLISLGADRTTTLIGVGGGVITDLTGFIASVYMRGIAFGFVPTTLLALVDASIGGKNGIDVGSYKNMVGTIRQPAFILQDLSFLKSLPGKEWSNGFAEIIKHAAIKDTSMFRSLEENDPSFYQKKKSALSELVRRNTLLKTKVVQQDEFEKGDRKLLNFGHTLGHALENQYRLSHGEAISIGMAFAARLSAGLTGFRATERLTGLLQRYELPVTLSFDPGKVIEVLKMDKKKTPTGMQFILLQRIGSAMIKEIPVEHIYQSLK
jgi:3-dehydroquinate synthase